MTFTREQKNTAYKKLSPEVQSFIMDNETTELIESYLKEVSLSEEQSNSADTDILCAMYGLQTLTEAINSIAKLSNKKMEDLSKLKTNLEENIFSKIPNNKGVDTPKLNKTLTNSQVKDRVEEIAKKYSLNAGQTDTLLTSVSSILSGKNTLDTFTILIPSELGISKLLAEQIMNDLSNRVFGYTLVQTESRQQLADSGEEDVKINVGEKFKPVTTQPNNIFADMKAQIKQADGAIAHTMYTPEIRPTNVPMVEKGEIAHDISVPKYVPPVTSKPSPEAIQRPVPVPRFVAEPITNEPEEIKTVPKVSTPEVQPPKTFSLGENVRATDSANQFSPKAPSIIDSKLGGTVKSMKDPFAGMEKPISETPQKKYVVDPYREPIN